MKYPAIVLLFLFLDRILHNKIYLNRRKTIPLSEESLLKNSLRKGLLSTRLHGHFYFVGDSDCRVDDESAEKRGMSPNPANNDEFISRSLLH